MKVYQDSAERMDVVGNFVADVYQKSRELSDGRNIFAWVESLQTEDELIQFVAQAQEAFANADSQTDAMMLSSQIHKGKERLRSLLSAPFMTVDALEEDDVEDDDEYLEPTYVVTTAAQGAIEGEDVGSMNYDVAEKEYESRVAGVIADEKSLQEAFDDRVEITLYDTVEGVVKRRWTGWKTQPCIICRTGVDVSRNTIANMCGACSGNLFD